MMSDDEDTRAYEVVMNHEEQYSIWLAGRDIPRGWVAVGKHGPKAECLQYIEQVWTDMRPLSLRKHMEATVGQQANSPSDADESVGNMADAGTGQDEPLRAT